MATLFMTNVPHDCSERELTDWVESRGIGVKSVRVIRDTVAGVSPSFAYVDIVGDTGIDVAVHTLHGQQIRERAILVSEARRGRTAVA